MSPRTRSQPVAHAPYHHGALRSTLLREAEKMLREQGIETFSLRRLAERSGVTAPALYHHFRDKNDLLCALAEIGFVDLDATITRAIGDDRGSERQRLQRFVMAYVGFAADRPEIYDLMFGRTIWKGGTPTESLRAVAYGTFRRYVEHAFAHVDPKARAAAARSDKSALRSAQVGWATVHGLCRLLIDGIYLKRADVGAMIEAAVDVLLAALNRT
jgi:AcrR family transcriptional regulator